MSDAMEARVSSLSTGRPSTARKSIETRLRSGLMVRLVRSGRGRGQPRSPAPTLDSSALNVVDEGRHAGLPHVGIGFEVPSRREGRPWIEVLREADRNIVVERVVGGRDDISVLIAVPFSIEQAAAQNQPPEVLSIVAGRVLLRLRHPKARRPPPLGHQGIVRAEGEAARQAVEALIDRAQLRVAGSLLGPQ